MKKKQQHYGQLPQVLGQHNISCKEMMFYMYLPISMPYQYQFVIEPRLEVFRPLIEAVRADMVPSDWVQNYIYLTAKHVFVNNEYSGNRPGWHSDGFMTDDLNYIWTDSEPTVFVAGRFNLTQDHHKSLGEMMIQAADKQTYVYPLKTLLKLDQYVIHRAPMDCEPGYRTFVKISVSKHKYNLAGNAHNYEIPYTWDMQQRDEERNHITK